MNGRRVGHSSSALLRALAVVLSVAVGHLFVTILAMCSVIHLTMHRFDTGLPSTILESVLTGLVSSLLMPLITPVIWVSQWHPARGLRVWVHDYAWWVEYSWFLGNSLCWGAAVWWWRASRRTKQS